MHLFGIMSHSAVSNQALQVPLHDDTSIYPTTNSGLVYQRYHNPGTTDEFSESFREFLGAMKPIKADHVGPPCSLFTCHNVRLTRSSFSTTQRTRHSFRLVSDTAPCPLPPFELPSRLLFPGFASIDIRVLCFFYLAIFTPLALLQPLPVVSSTS